MKFNIWDIDNIKECSLCRQCLGLATWPIRKALKIQLWNKGGGCDKIAWLFSRAQGTNNRCLIFHDDSKLSFRVCLCSVSHTMSTSPASWSSSISFLQSSHFHPLWKSMPVQCSYIMLYMLYTHCARWRISKSNSSWRVDPKLRHVLWGNVTLPPRNNLTQNSVVMRATRAAKIGARAGRLTRLVKLIRVSRNWGFEQAVAVAVAQKSPLDLPRVLAFET